MTWGLQKLDTGRVGDGKYSDSCEAEEDTTALATRISEAEEGSGEGWSQNSATCNERLRQAIAFSQATWIFNGVLRS